MNLNNLVTDPLLLPDVSNGAPIDADAWFNSVRAILQGLTATRAIAVLRQTVAQSIPANVYTPLSFDTEDADTDNGHSVVTNTSRYTAQTAGWYRLYGAVSFVANATGSRYAVWWRNGSVLAGSESGGPNLGGTIGVRMPVRTILVQLAVGDYIELVVAQDTAGALNTFVASASVHSTMCVEFVRTA